MYLVSECITDFVALAALRADWQALSARVPENTDFFATWDYTWVYLQVHQPRNWQVIAVRDADSGVLKAVFALVVFQMTGHGQTFRVCQPLGVGYVPYVEFPVDSDVRRDVLQLLLNTVLRVHLNVDVALFWPLHQASPLYLALLEDLGRTDVLQIMRFANNLHEIETRGLDFERHVAACPSLSFQNAAYRLRRLRKEGDCQFTLREPAEQLRPLVEMLCQLNQQKFGDQHVYRHLPKWSTFLPELVCALAASGLAEVSTLRLDGKVLALRVTFWYKQRRYLYLIDYDPAYAKFAPSKILNALTIEATFQQGGVFCFGAGAMPYKREWGPAVGELKAALVFLHPAARAALQEQLTPSGLSVLGRV